MNAIGIDAGTSPAPQESKSKTPIKKTATIRPKSKAGRQLKDPVAAASSRPQSKQDLLVELLRRKTGATIEEASRATGWQAHSIRGAISGLLKKKLGLTVKSEKTDARGRVYRITAGR